MNTIPQEHMQFNGLRFCDPFGTQYLIEAAESDISQLHLTEQGTCLNPSLEPSFELRVFEVDEQGYKGLSGQFKDCEQVQHYYNAKPVLTTLQTN